MAVVLKKLYKGYFWATHDIRDPRSDDYFIVRHTFFIPTVIVSYVYLVQYALPKFMKNRKPYDVRRALIIYNILHLICNSYATYRATYYFANFKSIFCEPIDYSRSPYALEMLQDAHIYCLIKIFDLLDTVFFILKKNFRQVSFLHVYHHALMVLATAIALKYVAGGPSIYVAVVNSPVHLIMFTYYLLSSIDTRWKNNLTVKKVVTQAQLVQFCILFVAYTVNLLMTECYFPKWISICMAIQNMFMFALFFAFYRKEYWKKTRTG